MATQKPIVLVSGGMQQLGSSDVLTVGRGILPHPWIEQSIVPIGSGSSLTALRAYFNYMGQVGVATTIGDLRFSVTGSGSGSQTAEAALYSSAAAPAGSLQDLTHLTSTGTVGDLTSIGPKTATFNYSVAAGTHLWCGFRCNMATTIPSVHRTVIDHSQLVRHSYAAPGALTSAGNISSGSQTLPGTTITGMCMMLTIT